MRGLFDKNHAQLNLKEHYKNIMIKLDELVQDLDIMRNMEYNIWHKTNKPFGFEYFDANMGAVETRRKSAKRRIDDFVSKKVDSLEELEEERLYYNGDKNPFIHKYF